MHRTRADFLSLTSKHDAKDLKNLSNLDFSLKEQEVSHLELESSDHPHTKHFIFFTIYAVH